MGTRDVTRAGQVSTYLLLSITIGLFAWYVRVQSQRAETLTRIESALKAKEIAEMGTMTSQWTSDGIQHTYETTQMDSETPAEHAARHAAGLATMTEKFPPD